MNKNYNDQNNMEKMGLKDEEAMFKKIVKEEYDQDGQRYEEGISINGNKEQQENDGQKYRDGIPMKENREVQQQGGQKYGDQTSLNDKKEYQQINEDYNPESQDEIYYQRVGQKESPNNQRYNN